jgi:hypothetical protein
MKYQKMAVASSSRFPRKRVKVTTYSYPPYCPKHKRKERTVMVTGSGKFKCAMNLKHGKDPDSMFDRRQLKAGIMIEKEHTNSDCLAKQIAKAHLVEDPRYYTKLKKVV